MDESDDPRLPENIPGEPANLAEKSEARRRLLKDLALAGAASPMIIAILSRESAAHAYCASAEC